MRKCITLTVSFNHLKASCLNPIDPTEFGNDVPVQLYSPEQHNQFSHICVLLVTFLYFIS